MITYNHEAFLEEAIGSVIKQQTSFDFVLVVGDDCSQDNTLGVLRKIQVSYPEKIMVYSNSINQGPSVNAKKIFQKCFETGAKYLAILEGDDCWDDPYKLQKQVDFLDENPDYIISFHEVEKIDPFGKSLGQKVLGESRWKDLNQSQLISGELVPSVSALFRAKYLYEFLNLNVQVRNGDTFLFAFIGQYGKAHFHADIHPAKYRIHGGGVWTGIDLQSKKEALIHTFETLRKVIKSENKHVVNKVLFDKYLDQFLNLDYPLATKIKLYFRLWGFSASNGLVGYLVKLHFEFVSKFFKKIIRG